MLNTKVKPTTPNCDVEGFGILFKSDYNDLIKKVM